MKGDATLPTFLILAISLSLWRIYFQTKGCLHPYFHLCPSLKPTEETASYVCTRVNIKMFKLLQAFQTRKRYILLLRQAQPMCALVLLNSSFQQRRESSLDADASERRWICTRGGSDCCQRTGLRAQATLAGSSEGHPSCFNPG